jgi:ADP-ribose pyrophosphatase YjhB (NUDIX family)
MSPPALPKMRTEQQVSAGGVVYRKKKTGIEFALIKVGPIIRWQLPKGIVDDGETPKKGTVRKLREESGLNSRVVAPIEQSERC